MLNKVLAEVEALRVAVPALQTTNVALAGMSETQMRMIAARNKEIADQQDRYDRLAKTKCSTSSFLIFIYRKKTCF